MANGEGPTQTDLKYTAKLQKSKFVYLANLLKREQTID